MADEKTKIPPGASLPLSEKELLLEIYRVSLKTEKLILKHNIISVIKLLIIVLPFLLALWYLPPFFERFAENYGQILEDIDSIQSPQ